MRRILANGVDFACIDRGDGPIVLLLHGFPDRPESWDRQIPALTGAGYRVVAPYLRGYPPTVTPAGAFYDKATLALDVAELIRALDVGPVHLVGQDWGASITYWVLAAFPELVKRAVAMAIPHSAQTAASLLDPKHVQRSFHWWFFQLPELPERAVAANDFAFVDYLWKIWSSPGYDDSEHVASVKRLLAAPGVLTGALAYYRAMFDLSNADPALDGLRQAMQRPIPVPTLALCGREDLRSELMIDQSRHFTGEYRFEFVEHAGHFLHREQPDATNRLLIEWLGRP
jgi:pimeloyl-ACP methyl ester carboxylesterase